MATTTPHIKFQTRPTKPKRRRYRETTITTVSCTAASAGDANPSSPAAACTNENLYQTRTFDTPIIVSADNSWCCPASKPSPPEPSYSPISSPLALKNRCLPPEMDSCQTSIHGGASASVAQENFPSSLSKFNSALTAGLLNPMSPPPLAEKARSSPTLFEMMANEPECFPKPAPFFQNGAVPPQNGQSTKLSANPPLHDRQALMQERLMELLASRSPGNLFNDAVSGDVKLTLSSKDGINVPMSVHRQILVAHSRFFALKLNEKWVKQQRSLGPYIVEIADCDDIEIYIETLRLMYCKDLRRKLMQENVPRVLGILKVSAAIGFDAGVLSCLEYLEASPWTDDEEQKIASLLSELRLDGVGAGEVLKRVSLDAGPEPEQTILKLLQVVLEGTDEKARREMKSLITKMLRGNSSQNDLSKESLYSASDACLKSLVADFLQAAGENDQRCAARIARRADNLHWLLDIMIDKQVAEDFLSTWASQTELARAHRQVAAVHRHEVSRVTGRLFVGIGKGQVVASREGRCMLVGTWLGPFYEDFGWMRRTSRGPDHHVVVEGLANTILTLPMRWQQEIMMAWFDRFLNCGDDCPNIRRGFEVWWRRAFWRRGGGGGEGETRVVREMRIVAAEDRNS